MGPGERKNQQVDVQALFQTKDSKVQSPKITISCKYEYIDKTDVYKRQVCRKEDVPGRLIPVPRQISAGCGLSWSMSPAWREHVMGIMGRQGLGYQTMGEYLI